MASYGLISKALPSSYVVKTINIVKGEVMAFQENLSNHNKSKVKNSKFHCQESDELETDFHCVQEKIIIKLDVVLKKPQSNVIIEPESTVLC